MRVYTACPYVHNYLETHAPYYCILHTKRRLYCQQCIILKEQSCLAKRHVVVSFQLIAYAIVKITTKDTTLPLYEFAAKQPKKEPSLEVKNFL